MVTDRPATDKNKRAPSGKQSRDQDKLFSTETMIPRPGFC